MLQKIIHKYFRLPYKLNIHFDSGKGDEVFVLLHGVAASGVVWKQLYSSASTNRYIVIDLLGFGNSPKPDFMTYNAEDHARSVVYTLNGLGVDRFHLVGHSMGALIALNIAASHPAKVKSLICVAMPAYDMSQGRISALLRYRTNAYMMLYKAMADHPELTWVTTQAIVHSMGDKSGLTLEKDSLIPFQKSLRETIIHQNALSELAILKVPTTVLIGRYDPFVIAKYFEPINVSAVSYVKVDATHILDRKLVDAVRNSISQMV